MSGCKTPLHPGKLGGGDGCTDLCSKTSPAREPEPPARRLRSCHSLPGRVGGLSGPERVFAMALPGPESPSLPQGGRAVFESFSAKCFRHSPPGRVERQRGEGLQAGPDPRPGPPPAVEPDPPASGRVAKSARSNSLKTARPPRGRVAKYAFCTHLKTALPPSGMVAQEPHGTLTR